MKKPIIHISFAALALAGLGFTAVAADSYSVFRICEDQHILKTSDGADAGHIEYIVVDPAQQRIVSSVITGGVVGTRHVSIPYSEFQTTGERDIVLHSVTRERIVAAPVIEVERFRTNPVIDRTVFEKSSSYFNVNVSGEAGRDLREPRDERTVAPGERGNDPRAAVRDAQRPPGPERGKEPRNGARDDQDRNTLSRTGNARDIRIDEEKRGGNETPNTPRNENAAQNSPAGDDKRKTETQASEKSRGEKSPAEERVGKNRNPEANRNEGATAKERRTEGAQKSEVSEDSSKNGKKGESAREDKPPRSSAEKKEPKGDEQR